MDNVAILQHVRGDLQAFATAQSLRVYVSIAGTHRRALELLATPPAGLFLVLTWDGEEDRSQSALSGIVEQSFSVFVSQAASLSPTPGQDLLDGSPGTGPALLVLVDAIRDRVRGLLNPDDQTDVWFWYRRASQVYDAGEAAAALNAFRLQFTLDNALPQPAYHVFRTPVAS